MAASITDEARKSVAYSCIARSQAKRQNLARARQNIAMAKTCTKRILEDWYKTFAYIDIAAAEAEVGDLAAARATAKLLTDLLSRGSAYCGIAMAQTRAGDIAGAKATIAMMDKEIGPDLALRHSGRDLVFQEIIRSQAKAGDAAGAVTTVERLGDDRQKAIAYGEIAWELARVGNKSGALENIRLAATSLTKVSDPYAISITYAMLAHVQAKAGDSVGACESLGLAKTTMAGLDRELYKTSARPFLAKVQAAIGDVVGARTMTAQIADKRERDSAYGLIVAAQAEAGATAAEITDSARVISDPLTKCEAIANAAKELCSQQHNP